MDAFQPDLAFLLNSAALGAACFASGALSLLFLKHRTPMLRIVLLFVLSLLVITAGFWAKPWLPLPATLASLAGIGFNIAVVPWLVAALLGSALSTWLRNGILAWSALPIVLALLFPVLPDPGILLSLLDAQLVATIAAALLVLAVQARTLLRPDLRQAIQRFLWLSLGFLACLALDMLITLLPLAALGFMDGFSLPAYILALSLASFGFASRFLSDEALVESGRLSEACKRRFELTPREVELIERLMDGSTNQELADALFISKKTVENHLYNIFQKMQVKNRVQLLSTLRLWDGSPKD